MNKTLIILRGVSGSGKSTFAEWVRSLHPNSVVCTADDYFCKDGAYQFDPKGLGEAHKQCQDKCVNAMLNGVSTVVVANTNTKESDFNFYIRQAETFGYQVFSMVLENRHGGSNVHNVPDETLKRQKENIINSLSL